MSLVHFKNNLVFKEMCFNMSMLSSDWKFEWPGLDVETSSLSFFRLSKPVFFLVVYHQLCFQDKTIQLCIQKESSNGGL